MYVLEVSEDGDHLFLGGKGAIKVQSTKKDPANMKPQGIIGSQDCED